MVPSPKKSQQRNVSDGRVVLPTSMETEGTGDNCHCPTESVHGNPVVSGATPVATAAAHTSTAVAGAGGGHTSDLVAKSPRKTSILVTDHESLSVKGHDVHPHFIEGVPPQRVSSVWGDEHSAVSVTVSPHGIPVSATSGRGSVRVSSNENSRAGHPAGSSTHPLSGGTPAATGLSAETGANAARGDETELSQILGTNSLSSVSQISLASGRSISGKSASDPRIPQDDGKIHILLGATGSLHISSLRQIILKLEHIYGQRVAIQVVLTKVAEKMVSPGDIPANVHVWHDHDEWDTWNSRSDPVVHIELRRWADILVIAPLSANTLGKIALGLCDNLLTNIVRAWNSQFPILVAPAMVAYAYNHPATKWHLRTLKEDMKWIEVLRPTEKVVGSTGGIGLGGMMPWNEIVERIVNKLGGYPDEDEEIENENDNDADDNDSDCDGDDDEEEEEEEEEEKQEKKVKNIKEPDVKPQASISEERCVNRSDAIMSSSQTEATAFKKNDTGPDIVK